MDFYKDWYERKFKPTLDEEVEWWLDQYERVFSKKETTEEELSSELIDLRYF